MTKENDVCGEEFCAACDAEIPETPVKSLTQQYRDTWPAGDYVKRKELEWAMYCVLHGPLEREFDLIKDEDPIYILEILARRCALPSSTIGLFLEEAKLFPVGTYEGLNARFKQMVFDDYSRKAKAAGYVHGDMKV